MPATITSSVENIGPARSSDDPLPPRAFLTACLVFTALLLTPFACDTWELFRLTATTTGTVRSVGVRRGNHGTSAPMIEYTYSAGGHAHVSGTFLPGLFSGGTWTGGGGAAGAFKPGQDVLVHYDPRNPGEACLAYGWHKWSIGLPFFVVGLGLQGWGGLGRSRARRRAQVAGWTLFPLGLACLALAPAVVQPSSLPLYAAIAAGLLAVNGIFRWRTTRRTA